MNKNTFRVYLAIFSAGILLFWVCTFAALSYVQLLENEGAKLESFTISAIREVVESFERSLSHVVFSDDATEIELDNLIVETVIDVESVDGDKVTVTTCDIDFLPYQFEPGNFPKFKNLVGTELCANTERTSTLDEFHLRKRQDGLNSIAPTGFVFHESRVGSTLAANILASSTANLVYSEPSAPIGSLKACDRNSCSDEQRIINLRETILAMGYSDHHKYFFIKFQSISDVYIKDYLAAFPTTPWIFIYRDPVQTMMSHFKYGISMNVVCTKSSHSVGQEKVLQLLSEKGVTNPSAEEYCATHLNMLCLSAIDAAKSQNHKYSQFVDYSILVDNLIYYLISDHFNVHDLSASDMKRMMEVSKTYSKASATWADDAKKKEDAAPQSVKRAASKFLEPTYELMKSYNNHKVKDIHQNARTLAPYAVDPNCPDDPVYPNAFPMKTVLDNWPILDTDIPKKHYSGICRFDFQKEYAKAMRYRDAEIPHMVYNVPSMINTVLPQYKDFQRLYPLLGDRKVDVTISEDEHFLYYSGTKRTNKLKGWTPPTKKTKMSFKDWHDLAEKATHDPTDTTHYYLNYHEHNKGNMNIWEREIPAFNTIAERNDENKMFVHYPDRTNGINCRFGMQGIFYEGHFDSGRNVITMLEGHRRWLIIHPDQCPKMYPYPKNHPSSRHTQVDWMNPDYEKYPDFKDLLAQDVIMAPGDILYLPAYYIHAIVSLDTNMQCNTRSGSSLENYPYVKQCGFEGHGIGKWYLGPGKSYKGIK